MIGGEFSHRRCVVIPFQVAVKNKYTLASEGIDNGLLSPELTLSSLLSQVDLIRVETDCFCSNILTSQPYSKIFHCFQPHQLFLLHTDRLDFILSVWIILIAYGIISTKCLVI